jgi:D-serine deaminase-like pyridoxal phosphate-dependent protein
MRLSEVQTPALILDQQKMKANIERMTGLIASRGIKLRPHLKTCKSIDVAQMALKGNFGGITVATLNEAEYFAGFGIRDILYGVCVTPDKLSWITELQSTGSSMTLITDSLSIARLLAGQAAECGEPIKVMIEVDCGEHRTGVLPDDPLLVDIAQCLHESEKVEFAGVFTHAGHSYQCRSLEEIERVAEDERLAAVSAADILRTNGIPCEIVSVGSTPTALHANSVAGITEIRAGVYVFYDLFQAVLQSCEIRDIAVSVLATVISQDKLRNRILIDAGGLALSKDRSTAATDFDAGYGRLINAMGEDVFANMYVTDTHQEHGEITSTDTLPFDQLPVGARVRVLPNHACMTSAMYDRYHVVDGQNDKVVSMWARTNGWQRSGFSCEAPA